MKRNRIINLLVLSTLLTLFTTSCFEDFLEKPKGGSVTTDTIFHTKNQAQYAVARMYQSCLRSYLVFTNSNECARPDILTDQVFITDNTAWIANNLNEGSSYYLGTMTAAKPADMYGFGSHYLGIRRANLVLKNIDMVTDAKQDWIDDQKGQALFLLAWQHFELFRYYGGIPIVDQVLGGGEVKLTRRSVESVVNAIVGWCDEAIALLPNQRGAADFGRVNQLAAMALKSRVLLYAASPLYNTPDNLKSTMGNARFNNERDSVLCYPNYDQNRWKLAADAAKAVLDNAAAAGVSLYNTGKPETSGDTYTTIGDYESVWNVYGNREIILANTQIAYNDWGADGSIWTLFNISKIFSQVISPGNPWGIMNHTPVEFATLYEKRDGTKWELDLNETGDDLPGYLEDLNLDPRFYQSIVYDGKFYNSSVGSAEYYQAGDGFVDGKLNVKDQASMGFAMETMKFTARIENADINHIIWPIFRLAEFYLNYAEAINEAEGPGGEALNAINTIRERAGMPAKSGLGQDEFRNAIQNERTIELAFENHRYNDLMRWVKAHETLNKEFHGFKTTAKAGLGGKLLRSWEISLFMNRIFPMKYYYLPFPNSEISINYLGGSDGWDGQNPGW
ncbi:MAG TPA: RagB/SusD family nutrient uptake outer membrane protein [Prolixibacteraceae bacterium]|nr:RagB/SusD family nutrient uptake outer membrane protein [Prolixibacteraceae bacterium]